MSHHAVDINQTYGRSSLLIDTRYLIRSWHRMKLARFAIFWQASARSDPNLPPIPPHKWTIIYTATQNQWHSAKPTRLALGKTIHLTGLRPTPPNKKVFKRWASLHILYLLILLPCNEVSLVLSTPEAQNQKPSSGLSTLTHNIPVPSLSYPSPHTPLHIPSHPIPSHLPSPIPKSTYIFHLPPPTNPSPQPYPYPPTKNKPTDSTNPTIAHGPFRNRRKKWGFWNPQGMVLWNKKRAIETNPLESWKPSKYIKKQTTPLHPSPTLLKQTPSFLLQHQRKRAGSGNGNIHPHPWAFDE